MPSTVLRNELDAKNAAFWNELCGSIMARSLGITEITPSSLRMFDKKYLAFYPYLGQYINSKKLAGKKVLEIGLGYGTLGRLLISHGCDYHGLDIAEGPVSMMRYSQMIMDTPSPHSALRGSALEIPFRSASFDYVYAIGCLHHTGDTKTAVNEVCRVLAPGGTAVVSMYNRLSFRQLVHVPLLRLYAVLSGRLNRLQGKVRGLYDSNTQGQSAPHTDYYSPDEALKLFDNFTSATVDIRNFSTCAYVRGRPVLPRWLLLNTIGRILGLDLYIKAVK